jgi:hypothetical protein
MKLAFSKSHSHAAVAFLSLLLSMARKSIERSTSSNAAIMTRTGIDMIQAGEAAAADTEVGVAAAVVAAVAALLADTGEGEARRPEAQRVRVRLVMIDTLTV